MSQIASTVSEARRAIDQRVLGLVRTCRGGGVGGRQEYGRRSPATVLAMVSGHGGSQRPHGSSHSTLEM